MPSKMQACKRAGKSRCSAYATCVGWNAVLPSGRAGNIGGINWIRCRLSCAELILLPFHHQHDNR